VQVKLKLIKSANRQSNKSIQLRNGKNILAFVFLSNAPICKFDEFIVFHKQIVNHDCVLYMVDTFCNVECKYKCIPLQCSNKQCKRVFQGRKEQKKCNECNIFKIEFLEIKDECCICYQSKYMIETQCKHRYCHECLMDDQNEVIRCHNCRTEIAFNKV
jgi:hypothetical protein